MRAWNPILPILLVAASLSALPAVAMAPGQDACAGNKLPYVLNVGLPRLPEAPELQGEGLQREVGALFADFYAAHGRCPSRTLQINLTVAGDYEILDWLGQGLIDVAVVPDLTLYLLTQHDSVPLLEMPVGDRPVGRLLLPAVRSQPLSERFSSGQWERQGDAWKDFDAFLEEAWNRGGHPSAPQTPRHRLILASHLSTPGFLDPVARAAGWLAGRERGLAEGDEKDRRTELFWQAFFAGTRFAVDCDSLERTPAASLHSCWQLPTEETAEREGLVDILFPGEGALAASAQETAGGPLEHEHLVIASRAAEAIFAPGLPVASVQLPDPLKALFKPRDAADAAAAGKTAPTPFLRMLEPEPTFGVRAFGFTVDEALRLLRQDQETSGRKSLALVLPGGGVKAAYQSRILDELYRRRYLKNVQAPPTGGGEPLDVRTVIGTSGGALLGFFVSQLGETGPWDLSEILWKTRDRFHKEDRFLESTDIFNWTDLLRYASVIASFLVLCLLLAGVSVPERAPLRPPREEGATRMRPWLMPIMIFLLLVAPFLVRLANGSVPKEQIPEFEGMIYALLAMIAMFADQSILHEREERREGHGGPWLPPSLLTVAGALLVILPLVAQATGARFRFLIAPVTFGPTFVVLAPLVLLGGLIFPLRSGGGEAGWRGRFRVALELLVPAGVALALYVLMPARWLDDLKMPFFLSGFLLVLVSLGANFFLGRYVTAGGWPRRLGYYGALLLSALLLLNLCWPGEVDPFQPWASFGKHTLDVTGGTFLVCVGLLFLMVGGVSWIYAAHRQYHLRLQDFLFAYVVVLLHALAVYGVLVGVLRFLPDWLSLLELTREFWLWLLLTSAALGILLLLAALGRLGGGRSHLVRYLRDSFELLCSHHPNGDFVTRRFLRMAAFAVFALVWWNLVVAPALYGNGAAHHYLEGAIARFEQRTGERGDGVDYRPTTRFIAPANLLEKDGTRYFLFVPAGDECPVVPGQTASGARWLVYRAGAATGSCPPIPDREFLHDAIFASGSPFPIFPAHLLKLPEGEEALVDGGYSNNVPVDVALKVSADQVLIVDSSSPVSAPRPPSRFLPLLVGDLVRNLGRLPGFLFERSQQSDRLSRKDLLVVSLAPSPPAPGEPAWPALFDFRRQTVQRMEDTAQRDLGRRIGLVESWGRPRFQLSVTAVGHR
jgi:predicted acylesterase/phospholipase RssA